MSSEQVEERRAKALELHLAGATYDYIAEKVGYASRSGAYAAVREALDNLGPSPEIAEMADTELARLDAMLVGLWPKARRGDVQAVDRVLHIEERRRFIKSLQEQAAPQSVVEGSPLDELARRRADASPPSHKPRSSGS